MQQRPRSLGWVAKALLSPHTLALLSNSAGQHVRKPVEGSEGWGWGAPTWRVPGQMGLLGLTAPTAV